jgi:hypothetical protein
MSFPRESDPGCEIHDALKSKPNCFQPWLAVALAAQETAGLGHQAHDLIESGWRLGHFLAVQDESRLPFVG